MPNTAIVPFNFAGLDTRIPALINVVHGYPQTQHKLSSATGTAPLEDGAHVTDHVAAKPRELELEGWVSDLVAIRYDPERQLASALSQANRVNAAAAYDAWTALGRLNQSGTPVRVITGIGVYEEMVITEVKGRQAGRGLRFTMKLEQILRVGRAAIQPVIEAEEGPAMDRGETQERGFVGAVPLPGPRGQVDEGTGAGRFTRGVVPGPGPGLERAMGDAVTPTDEAGFAQSEQTAFFFELLQGPIDPEGRGRGERIDEALSDYAQFQAELRPFFTS